MENYKREINTFIVTKEYIEYYSFTKKQILAYKQLSKYAEKCSKLGLTLLAKQDSVYAYPSKFFKNWMNDCGGSIESNLRIEIPHLCGVKISDSGADDTEYIKDKFIKRQY